MILQIKPAGAKAKSLEKVSWDTTHWIAQEKYNGWRFLQHFGGLLDRTHMTGRRTSSVTGELSEKGLCAPCLWPKISPSLGYTVLDGEVLPPDGASFHDIAGIMNVSPQDADIQMKKIGQPRYQVFDCLFFNGRDIRPLPQSRRMEYAREMIDGATNKLIRESAEIKTGQSGFYDAIVRRGGEGVILKDTLAGYGDSGAWLKVKKFHDLDVIVTGWKNGKGKYSELIGAAVVSVYMPSGNLMEVGRVSGMTDDVRLNMTLHPELWLGKVIEVRSQEFGREKLLHPRFRRARPDADPKEATWKKMTSDLGFVDEVLRGQLTLL